MYFDNLFKDFRELSLSSKLITLLPITIILGPFFSDASIVLVIFIQIYLVFKNRNFAIFDNNFFKIFLLFWFIIVCSSFSYYPVSSSQFWVSIKSSALYIRFGLFVIILFYLLQKEIKLIKVFKKILLITLLFVIIHALLIYFLRLDFLQIHKFEFLYFENITTRLDSILNRGLGFDKYHTDHRISGVFYDELVLGTYLLKMGFLYLSLCFLDKDNDYIKSVFFLTLLLFTIFITGDRSPTILSIMAFGIILIVFKIKIKYKIILFFSSSILIVIFLNIDPNIKGRFVDQIKYYLKQPDSFIKIYDKKIWYFSEGHAHHLSTALNIFKNNKIIGTGVKTFRFQCKKKEYNVSKYSCTTHPHNTYGQLLAETGIVGFLFVFLFFLYLILKIIRNFFSKNIQYYNSYQLILILLFVSLWPFMPSGSFFNNAVSIYNFLIFSFFMFISAKAKKIF
jgi:O-antigen ligase